MTPEEERVRDMSGKTRAAVAALAAAAVGLAALAYAGDGLVRADDSAYIGQFRQQSATSDDSGWEIVQGGVAVCENQRMCLEMDAATTHFTITDKTTGAQFSSAAPPETAELSTDGAELQSEVVLVYYDSQSNEHIWGSARESVENGSVVIKRQENTLRVYYTFGDLSQGDVLPLVLTPEVFENEILPALDAGQKRRLGRYYSLISAEEPDENFDRYREQYPCLETAPLYILRDQPTALQQEEVRQAMQDAGYTAERYAQDCAVLGIAVEQGEKATAFLLGVEYALTETGFEAAVLADTLVTNNPADTVTSVRLLNAFGSCGNEADGYILLPDGSGSILRYGESSGGTRNMPLYGEDMAAAQETVSYERTACLPVFGFCQNGSGVFAEVIRGAEAASLTVCLQGAGNALNQVYPVFRLREFQTSDIGGAMAIPNLNLYAAEGVSVSPRVRYRLLAGKDASYTGMAHCYRQTLLDEGVLAPKEESGAPLYLDFNCLITREASFFGVPFAQEETLSTLREIREICSSLEEQGIGPLHIRLRGAGAGGLENRVTRAFALDKRVGTLEELRELADWLDERGGRLAIDAEFLFVSQDGMLDGYSQTADTAKRIDKSLAADKGYDLVSLAYTRTQGSRYLLSPYTYLPHMQRYLATFDKALADAPISLSWGTAGSALGGDYDRQRLYDRCLAADRVQEACRAAVQETGPLVIDVGNRYALAYTDEIRNMALSDSSSGLTGSPVPFYPMVVRGCVAYTGRPLNLVADPQKELLASIECGAGLSYSWMTAPDSRLLDTPLAAQSYSLNWQDSAWAAAEQYDRLCTFAGQVAGQAITGHRLLNRDVRETVFANGVRVLVNYGATPWQEGSTSVPAEDFLVIQP